MTDTATRANQGTAAERIAGSPVGLRIHDGDATSLVRRGVSALQYLRAEGFSQAYLSRGWLRGTHVDLVALPEGSRKVPWEQVENLFTPPAPTAYARSDEDYDRTARALAMFEAVSAPLSPREPVGSRLWLDGADVSPWRGAMGDVRHTVLACLAPAYVDHLTGSSEEEPQRETWLLEAFVSLAAAHPFGVEYGAFSLRSHAEAYMHGLSAASREHFQQECQEHASTDVDVVARVMAGTTISRWGACLNRGFGVLWGATAAGVLTPAVLAELGERPTDAPPPPFEIQGSSQFHQAIDAVGLSAAPPPWFPAFRVLVNLFYQTLPLFSVSARDRFALCRRVAEAIDQATGISWQERLENTFATTHHTF